MEEKIINIDFDQTSGDTLEQEQTQEQEQEQEQVEPQNKLEKEQELIKEIKEWLNKYPPSSTREKVIEWNIQNGSIFTNDEIYEINWSVEQECQPKQSTQPKSETQSNPDLPRIVKKDEAQRFLDNFGKGKGYIERAIYYLVNGKQPEVAKEIYHWAEALEKEGKRPPQEETETSKWSNGKSLTEILDIPQIPPDYLVEPILSPGDKGYLAAPYKKGKTLLMLDLTLSLAMGRNWLGFKVSKPRKVLYIRFELKDFRFKERLHLMVNGMGGKELIRSIPIFEYPRGFEITRQGDRDWLKRMIDTHKPEVLLLDPFYKLTTLDIKDPKNAMPLIEKFEEIKNSYRDLLILVSTHERKSAGQGQETMWDNTYGPMIFLADMDYEIKLSGSDNRFTLNFLSNDIPVDPIVFERDPETLVHRLVGSEDNLLWNRIEAVLREGGEWQVDSKKPEVITIKSRLDEEEGPKISAQKIRSILNERVTQQGDIIRNPKGRVEGTMCNVNLYSLK